MLVEEGPILLSQNVFIEDVSVYNDRLKGGDLHIGILSRHMTNCTLPTMLKILSIPPSTIHG